MVRQIGDLVKDWRRINVSFTRARSKLIIFGSRKTLQAAPILSEFFGLMVTQGWIYSLPPDADKMYTLPLSRSIRKRGAQDVIDKENMPIDNTTRLVKKAKHIKRADGGLLNGRPILRNLLQNGD
jgi:DNA replication ATP-dependent helicase Dna2